jgi:hypothetical protein
VPQYSDGLARLQMLPTESNTASDLDSRSLGGLTLYGTSSEEIISILRSAGADIQGCLHEMPSSELKWLRKTVNETYSVNLDPRKFSAALHNACRVREVILLRGLRPSGWHVRIYVHPSNYELFLRRVDLFLAALKTDRYLAYKSVRRILGLQTGPGSGIHTQHIIACALQEPCSTYLDRWEYGWLHD